MAPLPMAHLPEATPFLRSRLWQTLPPVKVGFHTCNSHPQKEAGNIIDPNRLD